MRQFIAKQNHKKIIHRKIHKKNVKFKDDLLKIALDKKIKRIIAIGVRSKVSISKPISEDTFTFFLIKPYKLNVRATVIPIQGTSPSLIRK